MAESPWEGRQGSHQEAAAVPALPAVQEEEGKGPKRPCEASPASFSPPLPTPRRRRPPPLPLLSVALHP